MRRKGGWRVGFTLVELLVVIAIIGVLVAMLLPAVQAAREGGRRAQCLNNVRQIAAGVQHHLEKFQHFPSGGWGYRWGGHPDAGHSQGQPGGWIYNLLPFVEYQALHDAGRGSAYSVENAKRLQTPLVGFNCPTRRGNDLKPAGAYAPPFRMTTHPVTMQYQADYAVNAGEEVVNYGDGEADLLSGRDRANWNRCAASTGVTYAHSVIPAALVKDGLSMTYLMGEKHLRPECYAGSIDDWGDNESAYSGDDYDLHRWTCYAPGHDSFVDPADSTQTYGSFGSAHVEGFTMSFCDGSAKFLLYTIDPTMHRRLGNRKDGAVVNLESLQ